MQYTKQNFESSDPGPDDAVKELKKMVDTRMTPAARPLGNLEFAKLKELLPIYEEKLQAWWEAKNAGQVGQALSVQIDARTEGLHGRRDHQDGELAQIRAQLTRMEAAQAEQELNIKKIGGKKLQSVDLEERYLVQETTERTPWYKVVGEEGAAVIKATAAAEAEVADKKYCHVLYIMSKVPRYPDTYAVRYCESDKKDELWSVEQLQLAQAKLCNKAVVKANHLCIPKLNKGALGAQSFKVYAEQIEDSDDFMPSFPNYEPPKPLRLKRGQLDFLAPDTDMQAPSMGGDAAATAMSALLVVSEKDLPAEPAESAVEEGPPRSRLMNRRVEEKKAGRGKKTKRQGCIKHVTRRKNALVDEDEETAAMVKVLWDGGEESRIAVPYKNLVDITPDSDTELEGSENEEEGMSAGAAVDEEVAIETSAGTKGDKAAARATARVKKATAKQASSGSGDSEKGAGSPRKHSDESDSEDGEKLEEGMSAGRFRRLAPGAAGAAVDEEAPKRAGGTKGDKATASTRVGGKKVAAKQALASSGSRDSKNGASSGSRDSEKGASSTGSPRKRKNGSVDRKPLVEEDVIMKKKRTVAAAPLASDESDSEDEEPLVENVTKKKRPAYLKFAAQMPEGSIKVEIFSEIAQCRIPQPFLLYVLPHHNLEKMVEAWKEKVTDNMTKKGEGKKIPSFEATKLKVVFGDDTIKKLKTTSAGDLVATLTETRDKTVKLTIQEN